MLGGGIIAHFVGNHSQRYGMLEMIMRRWQIDEQFSDNHSNYLCDNFCYLFN